MSRILTVLILLLSALPARAGFWLTTWDEFVSPVTTAAWPYALGGASVTGILAIDGVEDSLGVEVQNETVENHPLGSWSRLGDISGQMVPNFFYVGGMYAMYLADQGEVYKSRSVHMLKSTIYAATFSTIVKNIAREPRPNGSNSKASFPSGHATTAFAFAAVVGTEHEWYWAVPAYALAGLVAYSRINDNQHRLHDVVGGAVVGLSYGLSLHYLYKDDAKKPSPDVALIPVGRDGLMLSVSGTF